MARKSKRDSIPEHFDTIDEAAKFWDTHSLADYWSYTKSAKFDIQVKEPQRYITLDETVASRLSKFARKKKTPVEVLVNLWIQERLSRI